MATVIKTVKPGGGGDYTSLAAWNTGEATNLVSAGDIHECHVYGGGNAGTVVLSTSWTTDASNYIVIKGAVGHRHEGVLDRDKAYVESYAGGPLIDIASRTACRVDGLQFVMGPTSSYASCVRTISGIDFYMSNCLCKGVAGNGVTGVNPQASGSSPTIYIWNNIFYDFLAGNAFTAGVRTQSATAAYIYNNTFVNCVYGIRADSGSPVAINNVFQNAPTTLTFGASSATNLTSSSSGPSGTDIVSTTLTFRDAANDDYRLANADTAAADVGTDLTSDTYIPFSTDALGYGRVSGASWDVGAFTWKKLLWVDPDGPTDSTHFTNLSAALAAISTTPAEPWVVECSSSSGTPDTTSVTMPSITTTAINTVTVKAADGHRAGPEWDSSKYNLQTAALLSTLDYCTFSGLQIEATNSSNRAINTYSGYKVLVEGCHIKGTANTSYGIRAHQNSSGTGVDVRNNIISGFNIGIQTENKASNVYNNTVTGCTTGVNIVGTSANLYNNICVDNTTDFAGTPSTSDTNLSSDATAPGTNSIVSADTTNFFVSSTDYTPTSYKGSSFNEAVGRGTDLSSDFVEDINGTLRAGWDIGAVDSGGLLTVDLDGTSGFFTTLNAAYTALAAEDFGSGASTLTRPWIIECEASGASFNDTTTVLIALTTTAEHNLTVRAASAHKAGPEWSTAKYTLYGAWNDIFEINSTTHCTVDGLQITRVTTRASEEVLRIGGQTTLVNNYLRYDATGGTGTYCGVRIDAWDVPEESTIVNNVIEAIGPATIGLLSDGNLSGKLTTIQNNTVINFSTAFTCRTTFVPAEITNNIVQGATTFSTAACTNANTNVTNTADLGSASGSGNIFDSTVVFAGTDYYQPLKTHDGTNDAYDNGTDVGITEDIQGHTRLRNDIGAVQVLEETLITVDTDGTQSPDWTSLSGAFSAVPSDLISVDARYLITCAATTSVSDPNLLQVTDITSDEYRKVIVQAADGHRASSAWDDTKYRITRAGAPIIITNACIDFDGLQIQNSAASGSAGIQMSGAAGVSVTNCFIDMSNNNDHYGGLWLVYSADGSLRDLEYSNNIVQLKDTPTVAGKNAGMSLGSVMETHTYRVYNNSVINGDQGIKTTYSQTTWDIVNNLCLGAVSACYSLGASETYSGNISSDTTAPGTDAVDCIHNASVAFVTDTYQPTSTSDGADFGTDLSAYFTTDITGATRTTPWDVGAVIYAASGAPTVELQGALAGTAVTTAAISRALSLAVSLGASASTVANLKKLLTLAASVSGSTVLTATIDSDTVAYLAASLSASAASTSDLTVTYARLFAASLSATSVVTPTLELVLSAILEANLSGSASIDTTLSAIYELATTAQATANLSATLSLAVIYLEAALAAQAEATGEITPVAAIKFFVPTTSQTIGFEDVPYNIISIG